jgi:hypothetical protein
LPSACSTGRVDIDVVATVTYTLVDGGPTEAGATTTIPADNGPSAEQATSTTTTALLRNPRYAPVAKPVPSRPRYTG